MYSICMAADNERNIDFPKVQDANNRVLLIAIDI